MRWLRNNFRGERGERIPHDFLNTLANFWNFFTVIGGTVQRRSDGRMTIKIDESFPVDTDGYDIAKNPDGRMTLEQNPEDYSDDADTHQSERQLRNVHLVRRGSKSVPFFVSEENLQGDVPDKIVGELYWATIDSDRYYDGGSPTAVYKSLAAVDTYAPGTTKGGWNLQCYGFSASGTCTAPYSIHTTNGALTNKTLTWACPVTLNNLPVAGSSSGADVLSSVSAGAASGSYATLTFQKRTLTVASATLDISNEAASTQAYAPLTFDYDDIAENVPHNGLDGSNAPEYPDWTEDNTGHDGRYLRIGANWSGDDYNNICNGIANDAFGSRGIDFYNGYLIGDGVGEIVMDYPDRTLKGYNASIIWKVTHALRLMVGDGSSNKWVDLIPGDGTLEIKDHNNNQLALFQLASP